MKPIELEQENKEINHLIKKYGLKDKIFNEKYKFDVKSKIALKKIILEMVSFNREIYKNGKELPKFLSLKNFFANLLFF